MDIPTATQLKIIVTALSSGGMGTALIICLYRWLMRKRPKSEKQKFDKDGNLLETERTWR